MPRRSPQVTSLTAALALLALGTTSTAQEFIYALNSEGRVVVNGAEIKNLKGGLLLKDIEDSDDLEDLDEIWQALAVDGSDWWALRWDGRVERNGEQQDKLGFDSLFEHVWTDLVIVDGVPWALRTDGNLNIGGGLAQTLPDSDFFFTEMLDDGDDVWSLRSDGFVFRNTSTPALFRFNGPDGVFGGNDGEDFDTVWSNLALDATTGEVLSVRRDGRVGSGDPADFTIVGDGGPPSADTIAVLPYPEDEEDVDLGKLYTAIDVLPDGRWVALRANGQVYREGDGDTPIVDYPGSPDELDDALYIDLVVAGDTFFALREDGRVYSGTDTTLLIDYPKRGYRDLVLGTDTPDLAGAKSKKPVATKPTVTLVVGDDLELPLLVTDVDTLGEDLVVTVDVETIPDGAVWDDETRTLTWTGVGPAGKSTLKFTVSDGVNKPVKGTARILVKDPDTNETKNRPPSVPKFKKLVALDGIELDVPLPLADLDGDELVVTFDAEAFPFSDGAQLTEVDGVWRFTWTPKLTDKGKTKVRIDVSDGTKTKALKLSIKVDATLLTFP